MNKKVVAFTFFLIVLSTSVFAQEGIGRMLGSLVGGVAAFVFGLGPLVSAIKTDPVKLSAFLKFVFWGVMLVLVYGQEYVKLPKFARHILVIFGSLGILLVPMKVMQIVAAYLGGFTALLFLSPLIIVAVILFKVSL